MKICTILGTRPEIIRLSRIIPKLDQFCNHTVVHTGQNYEESLSDIFFKELKIRKPDHFLEIKGTIGEQMSLMFPAIEGIFKNEEPDKVLILGDTNSSLCSIVAERMGIPVYHLEAGNRCFDKRVPEEVNRKLVDSISTYNLPYTLNSRENLINEGIGKTRIFTCGNPIYEVLTYYIREINKSKILQKLKLRKKEYCLATFHRSETVDFESKLREIIFGLNRVSRNLPVICSIHPRTKDKIINFLPKTFLNPLKNIRLFEPFGFFDFVHLEQNARVVLTDSGTVSEEACILRRPTIIMRKVTERPEIVECGAAILSGIGRNEIADSFKIILSQKDREWILPEGYNVSNVSNRVVQFVLGGYNEPVQR